MKVSAIEQLVAQAKNGAITRRGFITRATAMGLSTTAASGLLASVSAQDATPEASPAASPVAYDGPVGTLSISREEYNASVLEAFDFTEPAQTGGTLIEVSSTDISTLNAILPTDVYSNQILGLLHDRLVTVSAVDGTFVPGLADSWEIGPDGRTYTFHIHPGVTWHDGTPFTAADVEFSYDATLAEGSLSPRQSDVRSVLESYRAIDDLTIEFVALAPLATFLSKTVAQVGIVAKHIWQDIPVTDWPSDPASSGGDPARVQGTGPFVFVEWVANDHVTLAKNPNYWDAANNPVYLDQYIFRVVEDQNAAQQSLVTGESDILQLQPAQAVSLLGSNPEIQQFAYDVYSFAFFAPNQDPARSNLFLDVPTRQALMYSLDRDLVAESIYQGYAIRADGSEPVPSPAYAPDRMNTIYTYDPEKAKALLAEAGWADSDGDGILEKDGVKFSFECEYPSGNATYEQLLPYMQQEWAAIGIEMTPIVLPFPTLLDHVTSGQFVMAVVGFTWDTDPDQGTMFRTDAKVPAGFNLTAYSNPEYDRLNDLQNFELDFEKRIELIIEQTNIVNDDVATCVTTFNKTIQSASPRVNNYFPNAYSKYWSYGYTWLSQ